MDRKALVAEILYRLINSSGRSADAVQACIDQVLADLHPTVTAPERAQLSALVFKRLRAWALNQAPFVEAYS